MTLKQKVKLAVPPKKAYKFYMDAKLHGDLVGGKVTISSEAGSTFSAFGGSLKGKMLHAKSGKMIVQTWRSSDWRKEDADSILILVFNETETGTELEMIHANVPDSDADSVKEGWTNFYWTPWKNYIKKMKK